MPDRFAIMIGPLVLLLAMLFLPAPVLGVANSE